MPSVHHVLETALYCDDVSRAAAFYRHTLGLQTLFEDRRLAALDAGRETVLLLFRRGASSDGVPTPGGRIPGHDGSGPLHVAFAVPQADLSEWEARLAAQGVAIESRVTWGRGGRSLYFRDPEGHSVELVSPGVWTTY
jgi:catechol 2,3-dioxygenase-like lactoylglutathione lyase family enzyme